jgi:hypothetical protein
VWTRLASTCASSGSRFDGLAWAEVTERLAGHGGVEILGIVRPLRPNVEISTPLAVVLMRRRRLKPWIGLLWAFKLFSSKRLSKLQHATVLCV